MYHCFCFISSGFFFIWNAVNMLLNLNFRIKLIQVIEEVFQIYFRNMGWRKKNNIVNETYGISQESSN